jgi:dipeptidyl aminopeptidase/acylaminoacyl peptidase
MKTLLALLALGAFSGSLAAPPPEAEVFGALPEETQPAISPDGHWLAWSERKDASVGVVIFDLGTRQNLRVLGVAAGDTLVSLAWLSNETLLMELQIAPNHPGPGRQVLAQNVATGESREVVSRFEYLVAAHTSKPDTLIIATRPPNVTTVGAAGGYTHLLEVDARTGNKTPLREGGKRTRRWFVDRDGHPVAREDWEWLQNQFCVYAVPGNTKRELLCRDDSDPPNISGMLADGSALVLLEANGRSHEAAWALPLDGSHSRLLAELPDADITSVFLDPHTGAVTGVLASGLSSSIRWLDPAAEQRYTSIAHAFPNLLVEPYGWTEDGSKTLARVSSAATPPVYYLTDFKTHKADIAAETYPGLSGVALGEVKQISYKSRDGTDIPAYLATPPGGKPPYALVVLPHGGPNERDYLLFNPLVQFLATRGYAVLQPEFRGSSGFGDAYRDAGDQQWGGRMQDDVTDGVRALVAQQLADPSRVCIVGDSPYSGYAALAGAAFTPELYACAVSINGVSDLPAYVTALLPGPGTPLAHTVSSSTAAKVEKRIGKPGDPILKSRSPITAVAAIRAHVLIMYSANAGLYAVQSANMARALTAAGKDVTLDSLPADAWANSRARTQIFSELERFLHLHLHLQAD